MKYILSMILCSGVATSCLEPIPLEDRLYDDVYSCMIAGYKESSSKIIEKNSDLLSLGRAPMLNFHNKDYVFGSAYGAFHYWDKILQR